MRIFLIGGAPRRGGEPLTFASTSWHVDHPFRDDFHFEAPEKARATLAALVEATRGFDAVLCETGTAMLLTAEWAARRLSPQGLVILHVHGQERIDVAREWCLANGREDPWPELSRATNVAWLAPTRHQEAFLHACVPEDQVHLVFFTSTGFSFVLRDPQILDVHAKKAGAEHGPVLFPGSGQRDWEVMLDVAVRLPDTPCLIIGGRRDHSEKLLARHGLSWPANLTQIEQVGPESFVERVGSARVVVIPLVTGDADGGHTTIMLANRLGVPLVCSDSPTLADYTSPGSSCLLAPPEDGAALAEAVRRATSSPLREQLIEGGQRFERALDALYVPSMLAALEQVHRASPR